MIQLTTPGQGDTGPYTHVSLYGAQRNASEELLIVRVRHGNLVPKWESVLVDGKEIRDIVIPDQGGEIWNELNPPRLPPDPGLTDQYLIDHGYYAGTVV